MTPLERFDNLFDRVMRADEGADTATVNTVAPTALAAYDQLLSPDVDARFHAGLIRIAAGDLAGAMTLAASIAAERPGHLFALLLRGTVAEENRDQASLAAVQREFLQVYPTETAAQRPEYAGHQIVIERFLKDATK